MSDLKLCPKCGGVAVIDQVDFDKWRVKCWWDMSCCHHTDVYPSEKQAKNAWNENNPMPLAEYHFPVKESSTNE